jgi:hypothetical protein
MVKEVKPLTERQKAYHKYLASEEWYNLKIDLIQLRGFNCENCGQTKKDPRHLQIHHLTYERLYNECASDLLILCARCHMKEHGLIKEKIVNLVKHKNSTYKSKIYKKIKKNKKPTVKKCLKSAIEIENKRKAGHYKTNAIYLKARKVIERKIAWV